METGLKSMGVAVLAAGLLLLSLAGCRGRTVKLSAGMGDTGEVQASLKGVWRSTRSPMAFRLFEDGRADYFGPGSGGEIIAAIHSMEEGRLRIEARHSVHGFLLKDGRLEGEGGEFVLLRGEDFLKSWLADGIARVMACWVPATGQAFRVRDELAPDYTDLDTGPMKRGYMEFGRGHLRKWEGLLDEGLILRGIEMRTAPNSQIHRICFIDERVAHLPQVPHPPDGMVGFVTGSFDVLGLSSDPPQEGRGGRMILSGTYRFLPNDLGSKLMEHHGESLRSEYKFRAAVRWPGTLAGQPVLEAWDGGYADADGYWTGTVGG